MPWKTADGTYLKEGRGWTDSDGIKHPSNWMIWTEDYKKNTMNLTWEAPLGPFDNFYYYGWNSDGDALLPKPLAGLQSSKVSDAKSISASLDEQVYYYVGRNSDNENAVVIGGLVNNTTYFVHSAATNTFKLSESHSNCGDEEVVSLTGLSSDGTKQTFTSQGKPGKGQTWPNSDMPKYDGA